VRVLVVDKDHQAAETLALCLKKHGHRVRVAETAAAALELYGCAELVLIELELSDLDGLELCRTIRANSTTPVIAVTSRTTELDRVLGLSAGADDYLPKPYGQHELMARIDAVMRRVKLAQDAGSAAEKVIDHGPLRIDASAREVRLGERLVAVTRKEFDLLWLLASRPDEVVSRAHILDRVWDFGAPTASRTVDTHVNTLRNKLGNRSWIVTVRGIGFRMGQG